MLERVPEADPADLSMRLKAMFDPTPVFGITTAKLDGKTIRVIHFQPHASWPVMAVKSEWSIKEGDIVYRYPGQSFRIT